MNTVLKVFLYLVLAGLFIALLRVFNGDIFGVFDWIWDVVWDTVLRIADFFSGNEVFRGLTEKPQG